jgi:hypothetical protein
VTELLSDAALGEFVSELRRLGAPVADALAPGLTDAEIDELLAPLGIDLPEEARRWWRWHNGTDPHAPLASRMFGHRHLLSLQDEASFNLETRDVYKDAVGIPKLLRPIDQKPEIFFDCRRPGHGPVPIYWQDDIEPPEPLLPSIGALVRCWIDVMKSGYVSVDDQGIWQYDDSVHPPNRQVIGFH